MSGLLIAESNNIGMVNGFDVVMGVEYDGIFSDPNNSYFSQTLGAVANPSWMLVMPEVKIPGVVGHLPPALRQKIAELEGQGDVSSAKAGSFPVGKEIALLQGDQLDVGYMIRRLMQWYLLDPSNSLFDVKYPDKP